MFQLELMTVVHSERARNWTKVKQNHNRLRAASVMERTNPTNKH